MKKYVSMVKDLLDKGETCTINLYVKKADTAQNAIYRGEYEATLQFLPDGKLPLTLATLYKDTELSAVCAVFVWLFQNLGDSVGEKWFKQRQGNPEHCGILDENTTWCVFKDMPFLCFYINNETMTMRGVRFFEKPFLTKSLKQQEGYKKCLFELATFAGLSLKFISPNSSSFLHISKIKG